MRNRNWLAGLILAGACRMLVGTVAALEITSSVGPLGEITTWLIVQSPEWRMDVDPFAPLGGEAVYAAMTDPKLIPYGGNPLEMIAKESGEKIRIGDGVWEARRMAPPPMPGIWNEYPRLTVPEGYRYAYCRLDSPREMRANLLGGINRGKYRLYLNGKDLGLFDGGFGWEFAREVPVELRQGANHLLVRFNESVQFACRLVGTQAEPLDEVKVTVGVPKADLIKTPEPIPVTDEQRLLVRAAAIAPPAPPLRPDFAGARLGRTMALLESGRYTHRPFRIIFSGQSIETEWTHLLVQRLRERFPGTEIVAENRAIGGWFVWRMHKLMKHDILRWQPDLVLFSAYQGDSEVWERLFTDLRSETSADIVIRSQHIDAFAEKPESAAGSEADCLRALCAKYDAEYIEVRQEWLDYLNANNLQPQDLLRDKIHLNAKGETLMALLYERHFVRNPAAAGWADRVRRYDVGRFLADGMKDGIVLEGDGWKNHGDRYVRSGSPDDRLRLTFEGNRVDLVLPQGHGRATVLIDGKRPSELNLFHGTRPQERTMGSGGSNIPMTYHLGANMQRETWLLTLTEGNQDEDPKKAGMRVKFTLSGSKTGFDGEGWNDRIFVSNSGRITLLPSDWATKQEPAGAEAPVMRVFETPRQIVWHILPDGRDEVPPGPPWRETPCHYFGQPNDYVTIADGLPRGPHELTLIPVQEANRLATFSIVGADVYRPPMER